jgi:drug/metabolite transporter (DMT)-like permease
LRPLLGIGYKVASIFLFVIMMAMVKILDERVPLGQTIFFRALIGLCAVFFVYRLRGEFRQTFTIVSVRKHINWALCCACAMMLWFTALTLIPLPEATAIGFVVPLITVALAWLVLGERVRIFRWMAVLVGLLGVGIIIWPRLGAGADYGSSAALGAMVALCSATLWALAQIFLRRLTETESSGSAVLSFSVATMVLGLVSIMWGWVTPGLIEWVAIAVCGLAGGFGQLCIAQSLRYGEASTMAPFEYLTFPVASIVGIFFFSEYPDSNVWYGLPLVVVAGLFVMYRERQLSRRA